ncbi:hypothetical protein CAPTEDRAFT_170106, partial [Capitella teleta]
MAEANTVIADRVIKFFNEELFPQRERLSTLPDVLKEFKDKCSNLEQQLSLASKEAPNKIQTALTDAENGTDQVTQFCHDQEVLHSDICNHLADTTAVTKDLVTLSDQIKDLQRYSLYLQWVAQIDSLSEDIQSSLTTQSPHEAIVHFLSLVDLTYNINSSKCSHLVQFASDSVLFWYKIIKSKLSVEMEDVLNAWGWPFIVSTVKQKSLPAEETEAKKNKLSPVFISLLRLQLPDILCPEAQKSIKNRDVIPGWRPLLLPLQLMVLPLKKRFKFHFFGNKQTNSKDKPEWYFTQALTWIRDHRMFLEDQIQPILDRAGKPGVVALVEFCRGIVALVIDKMQVDLEEIMFDDIQFCHQVDETLAFDKELRDDFSYPLSQPSCLSLLTSEKPFQKWINTEYANAVDKMDGMMTSSSAWQSQYMNMTVSEGSDLKAPECAEAFVVLMTTILERYRNIRSVERQVRFSALQVQLLCDYRERLVQVKDPHPALSATYSSVLNAIHYVLQLLQKWAEDPFFVELYYWKCQEKSTKGNAEHEEFSAKEEDDLKGFEGSLFDGPLSLFQHTEKQMLDEVVSYVFDDVKARTYAYQSDKWLAVPSQKDVSALSLSENACEMLYVLRKRLLEVQDSIAVSLFINFWQRLAVSLSKFIFTTIICQNHFSEAGAAQLNFDMTRNLFPLFGQYTTRPENHFKEVKEALILLTLKSGNIILLRNILKEALHSSTPSGETLTDPVATLQDFKVYKLGLEQARFILNLRVDVS